MSVRPTAQLGFADVLVRQRAGVNDGLERLRDELDMGPIRALLREVEPKPLGAPGYGAELLFWATELTPANVNDTEMAEALITGDEQAVYGDKAYDSQTRRRRFKAQGIKPRIAFAGQQASSTAATAASGVQPPHRACQENGRAPFR
jgi:hypothetical protein